MLRTKMEEKRAKAKTKVSFHCLAFLAIKGKFGYDEIALLKEKSRNLFVSNNG